MSLRPLLDIALDDERFLALAATARERGPARAGAGAHLLAAASLSAGRAG